MKRFLIDFNTESRDDILEQLHAIKVTEQGEFIGYFIDINNLEDLGKLEKKVYGLTGEYYSLIVSVCEIDGNTIYLDKSC